MKVRYVGDGTDAREPFAGPGEITQDGFTFVKGGAFVDVPDDHPRADKYRNNATFQVQGDKRPTAPADDDADAAALRASLAERGIEAPEKAKPSQLRKLLEKSVAADPPAEPAPPPVPE